MWLYFECCKCTRMRFNCANVLVMLLICVYVHLRGETDLRILMIEDFPSMTKQISRRYWRSIKTYCAEYALKWLSESLKRKNHVKHMLNFNFVFTRTNVMAGILKKKLKSIIYGTFYYKYKNVILVHFKWYRSGYCCTCVSLSSWYNDHPSFCICAFEVNRPLCIFLSTWNL